MRASSVAGSLGLVAILVAAVRAEPTPPGQVLFESYCVYCHASGGSRGSALDLAGERVAQRTESELLEIIRRGVPGTEMQPFGLSLTVPEIGLLVAHIRSMQGRPFVAPPALQVEDPREQETLERGRRVYFGRARCGECHNHGLQGGLDGPDLTGLGARMSQQQLLQAIEDPSAQITPGYETWVVETGDGRVLRGRVRKETDASLQILDESGELWRTWLRQDLRSARRESGSTMPANLLDPLSPQERQDLLHFLAR